MVDYSLAGTELAQSGAVVVIPTDTVYGLVARAADEQAVSNLYALKHRERKPGTVLAASVDQLVELGLKRRYLTAVSQFWPGAISVVVACSDPKLAYIHQGLQSIAVRIPDDADLRALLTRTGPLVSSSANQPGETPAETVLQAKQYFGQKVPLYIDGGDLAGRQASTVVRVVDDAIEVLRQGAVQIQ